MKFAQDSAAGACELQKHDTSAKPISREARHPAPSPQAADEISARCERERQCFSWQISLQAAGLLYCGCLTLHLSDIATQPAPAAASWFFVSGASKARNNAATAIRPGGFSVWFTSVHLRKNQRAGRDAASSLSGRSSDTMVSAGEVADASTDRRTADGRCCDDASAGRFAIGAHRYPP